jgi:hypothetical protein
MGKIPAPARVEHQAMLARGVVCNDTVATDMLLATLI